MLNLSRFSSSLYHFPTKFNHISPNSDENEISFYIITTIQAMRIKEVITKIRCLDIRLIFLTSSIRNVENSKENMHFYIRA